MDKIFSLIKGRIFEYLDIQGIKRDVFYKNTGISPSNFKGKGAISEIGGDKIAKILTIYLDINPDWLLTGQGEMLRSDSNSSVPQQVSEPQSTQYSEVIALLKEQLKDKEAELKELNQEIGVLKHDNRKLMEQVMGLDVSERKSSVSTSQSPPKDAPSVTAHL